MSGLELVIPGVHTRGAIFRREGRKYYRNAFGILNYIKKKNNKPKKKLYRGCTFERFALKYTYLFGFLAVLWECKKYCSLGLKHAFSNGLKNW
jgi:hypothetical protein